MHRHLLEFKIFQWYISHSQNEKAKIPLSFKYGLPHLVKSSIYKVFRGINISQNDWSIDILKKQKTFTTKGDTSWTISFDVAKNFAFGNEGNAFNPKTTISPGFIGIVVIKTLKPENILIDVRYAISQYPKWAGELKFSNEYEIISKPTIMNAKIFKLYFPNESTADISK